MGSRRNMRQTRVGCASTTQFSAAGVLCAAFIILALAGGCQPTKVTKSAHIVPGTTIQAMDMNSPLEPQEIGGAVQLSAAKNEWISFAVRIGNLPQTNLKPALQLHVSPTMAMENFSAYQVLPMPVATNRAGYVRQTGLAAGAKLLPRALLPMRCENGVVDLSTLRNPAHPFDPQSRADGDSKPAIVWIDIHVPSDAPTADYTITCGLGFPGQTPAPSGVQVSLHVFDFAIPQDRHLLMVSDINWDRLRQLYPDNFEAITPRLMNRDDHTYAAAIKTLDQLVSLAERNRTEVVAPRLQPTVKWPVTETPEVDWSDFDTIVSPWLSGDAFADKAPLGYWPLPGVDYLNNYDAASQREYWSNASTHFNRQDWLSRSAVFLPKRSPGRATALESIQLSMAARAILDTHPLVRVGIPLEDDQLQFASSDDPLALNPATVGRIISLAPGLVFDSPTQSWPTELRRPEHWLQSDAPGLDPYIGAGTNEQDVRLWAWLAYLRHADLIRWSDALPDQDDPTAAADPSKLTWFYPGSWFGVDEPVASIQLKWLRRAQQDYEYLLLAEQRGMRTDALLLARLITRQVELRPVQAPDPEYELLSGTVDQKTWDEAHALLARAILVCPPAASPDDPAVKSRESDLNLDIVRWQEPKERPYVLPRTAEWFWDDPSRSNGDKWAFLRLGVDIYNAGDSRPDQNQLRWTRAGDAWQFKPEPQLIGALRTYWVQRFSMNARVNLDRITPDSRRPIEITFVDGYTRNAYVTQAALPVATSARREGNLRIDGNLDDWSGDDLIHDGQLTKMMDRPSIQHWRIEPSSQTSQIYTGWSDDDFYVAFRVNGVSPRQALHQNFVNYEFRRAWGEDLCEILVQPIYDDNSLGPLTYVVCKPNGVCMVKRRLDPRMNADPWREIDGTAVRYSADPRQGAWPGEVAIPWQLLLNGNSVKPRLLRFNFIQHMQSNGESASWAGPIDFDRDDSFMGLLYLQELSAPGLHR
ncbi:MAG TPA: hypothetical protein VHX86_11660 [Tepidisphaeraceae bacterium]|nr:hypothetical protein [Tepidisphaeraceae bacterium]